MKLPDKKNLKKKKKKQKKKLLHLKNNLLFLLGPIACCIAQIKTKTKITKNNYYVITNYNRQKQTKIISKMTICILGCRL